MSGTEIPALLLRWFALPVHHDALDAEHADLSEALLACPERDTAHASAFAALLGADADGVPPVPVPQDDLGRTLSLLARGESAVIAAAQALEQAGRRGESLPPSDAVAALAAELDALASRSFELSGLGLARAVQTHARLWLYASTADPLAPASLALLREALGEVDGTAHRRGVAHAFAVLGRAAASGGRSDLWQQTVSGLDARHGPLLPRDLAWWIAGCAGAVVARDSRWFRAQRTREQAEALLAPALASRSAPEAERAEAVLVELAMAFAVNPDLDERPFLVTLDRIVEETLPRLSGAGARDHLLLRAADLGLRSTAPAESLAAALDAWLATATRQGPVAPEITQTYTDATRDLRAAPGDVEPDPCEGFEPIRIPDDAVPGVPVGLYALDANVRVAALRAEFGGWAFSAAEPGAGDAFYEAVPVLAELYSRGIADPVEAVREASVVFARRLIYGYSQRRRNPDGMVWVRRVIADTAPLASPRCHRAYVVALADCRIMEIDRLAVLSANDRLAAAVAGSQADYAVVERSKLALWQMREMDDEDPDKVWESEKVVEQLLASVGLDEYETEDWGDLIRTQRRWLLVKHARAGRWGDALRNARGYLEWLDDEPDDEQLRTLGVYHMQEFARLTADPAAPLREQGEAVARDARGVVARERPELVEVFDALAALKVAGEVWDADQPHGLAAFDRGLAMARAALPQDPEGRWGLASWASRWWRWLFIEAEAIESGSRSGPQRPYVATTRAVVLYLHHRLDEVDPDRDTNLGDIVTLAAHPGTFLSSTVDADVRALCELLVPRLDGHPDKEEAAKVRELARKAAKRGRGWFGR